MFFTIAFIIWIVVGWISRSASGDYDDWSTPLIIFLGFIIMGIWYIAVINSYVSAKAELQIIDEKISVIEEMNQKRVDDVIPILEKYPQIEKEIIGEINPNNFAVIGSVYPDLKSDTAYQQQAQMLMENIKKVEELEVSKLEMKKSLVSIGYHIWFLK